MDTTTPAPKGNLPEIDAAPSISENIPEAPAKKVKTVASNSDLHPERVEDAPIIHGLGTAGYIRLICKNGSHVKGEMLSLMEVEYKFFTVAAFRCDTSGYYLVMEETAAGDTNLKKLYSLISGDIVDGRWSYKNIARVEMVKRS